ncbi:MAG: hypothetical protein R3D29_14055 [Nitratireductor sp.]
MLPSRLRRPVRQSATLLDDALLTEKTARLAPVDGKAGIIADLQGKRINMDDLLAVYSLARGQNASELASHDLDVRLRADTLEVEGLSASKVDTHFRVEDGSVSLDQLNIGDFVGAKIESTGKLADVLGKANGSFQLKVQAEMARGLPIWACNGWGKPFSGCAPVPRSCREC